MSPAEIEEYLYRNGARAFTIPAPGQPGADFFSNGARINTIPSGPYHPVALPPPIAPSPSSSSAPVTPSVRPTARPAAVSPTPRAAPAASIPLTTPSASAPSAMDQAVNQSRASEIPLSSAPPSPAEPALGNPPQETAPSGPAAGTPSREDERTPFAGPLRLVDDAESAAVPFQFVSGVFGGMVRALTVAVVMLSFSAVTIYALSLGIKRRTDRARRRHSDAPLTKPN